jgi:hypothetical protein
MTVLGGAEIAHFRPDRAQGRLVCGNNRQAYGDFRPARRGLTNNHLTAVVGDDTPALGESKTQAAACFATAEKRVKHMRSDFGGDSRPIISNGNFYLTCVPRIGLAHFDADIPALANCLQRVDHQRVKRDGQLSCVCLYLKRLI